MTRRLCGVRCAMVIVAAAGVDLAAAGVDLAAAGVDAAAAGVDAAPAIVVGAVRQRYPWGGWYDITYTASGIAEACGSTKIPALKVWAVNPATLVTNVATAASLSGDTTMADGPHHLVWNLDAPPTFQNTTTPLEFHLTALASPKPHPPAGTQLWPNGPYFAPTNLGAPQPHNPGYHFWWGDTIGYTNNHASSSSSAKKWLSVQDGTNTISFSSSDPTASQTYDKDLASLASAGWIDSSGNLAPEHDAATVHLGSPWRLMTKDELDTLVDPKVCTATWTSDWKGTGVSGYVVTGAKEGYTTNSIFLPAAGYGSGSSHSKIGTVGEYLTSTPVNPDKNKYSYLLYSNYDPRHFRSEENTLRCGGFSVRPVCSATSLISEEPIELCTGTMVAAADLRTGTIRNAAPTETLTYSTNYLGGESVTITVNDTVLASGLTGDGTIAWTPDPDIVGEYTLRHRVYDGASAEVTNLTARFYSPKAKLALEDASGNTVEVKLNRTWVEAKTGTTDPTAQTNVLNVAEGNGQRRWENNILGLNGSDVTARPVIVPIQLNDPSHVGFRLGGVTIDTASGASVSNRVWRGSTPGARDRGSSGLYSHEQTVEEAAPSSGVQYYRFEVNIR